MAKNENAKSKAEIYREERKERLAKAAKKNAKNAKSRKTAVSVAKKVIAAVLIVAIVGGIAYGIDSVFGFSNNWKTALTVGEHKISVAQFNYYYQMSYNYYAQMESTYQQQGYSLGFDTTKAPDEVLSGQKDENGVELYWSDIIKQYAIESIKSNFGFYSEAMEAGYSLTDEEAAEINDAITSLEESAKANGLSLNAYIRNYISKGLTEKGLRELIEIETIASRYEEDFRNETDEDITEDDIKAEYEENINNYNYVDIVYYQLDKTLTKEDGESDDDFNARKEQNDADLLAAAEDIAAKATDIEAFGAAALEYKTGVEEAAKAEEEADAEADTEESAEDADAEKEEEVAYPTKEMNATKFETLKATFNEDVANWAYNAESKANDVKVFSTDKYIYVVYLAAPSYEGSMVNVRHLLVKFDAADSKNVTEEEKKEANKKLNEIIASYEKDENGMITISEEDFIKLAKEHSEDTTASNGGLIEGITVGSNYVENFKNWSMDKNRKAGDCAIIETEYGYHLMYFVEVTGNDWEDSIRQTLQGEHYEEEAQKIIGENGKYQVVIKEKNVAKSVEKYCDNLRKQLNQQAMNNSYYY